MEEKDLFGIGKKFRVEYIESGNYSDAIDNIRNGEIEPTIIVGTLIHHTNPVNGRIFVRKDGCTNIIPLDRVVSMIHIKNTSNEVLGHEEI